MARCAPGRQEMIYGHVTGVAGPASDNAKVWLVSVSSCRRKPTPEWLSWIRVDPDIRREQDPFMLKLI